MPELGPGVPRDLTVLAARALDQAASHLGQLLGTPIQLTHPAVRVLPVRDAVRSFGGEEAPVVAVQLSLGRDLSGQILLLLTAESAGRLIRLCLPEPAPAAVEESVLAEVGNVAGSAFVNEVADRLRLSVQVSPPQVTSDMAGAILGSVLPLAEAAPGKVLLIETEFVGAGQGVDGFFLLAPDGPSLTRLLGRAGRGGSGNER